MRRRRRSPLERKPPDGNLAVCAGSWAGNLHITRDLSIVTASACLCWRLPRNTSGEGNGRATSRTHRNAVSWNAATICECLQPGAAPRRSSKRHSRSGAKRASRGRDPGNVALRETTAKVSSGRSIAVSRPVIVPAADDRDRTGGHAPIGARARPLLMRARVVAARTTSCCSWWSDTLKSPT